MINRKLNSEREKRRKPVQRKLDKDSISKEVENSTTLVKADAKAKAKIDRVFELFERDSIDLTCDNRDYFAEAFLTYMDANMPPILNRLDLPISIIKQIERIILEVQRETAHNTLDNAPNPTTKTKTRKLGSSPRKETRTIGSSSQGKRNGGY